MVDVAAFLKSPFSFLFARSRTEQRLVQYVLREHARGRTLQEILDDPFVENRTTPEQRARLLDHPDVVHAIAADTAA